MNESSKNAVAYVRISSVKQIDNESPETQKEIIQKYADNNGIHIIEWFFDEAKSGKNTEREELKNLIAFALKYRGKIDHVLVYKMNRMSRDIDSYIIQVKAVLKSRGISIRSATEPIDDSVTGRLMENLLIMLGQVDNEIKSGVTIDNMRALALQGYWQHPPIVGYETDKIENDNGKLRPTLKISPMAEKVKSVIERYSQGDISQANLQRYAAKIGLRSRYGNVLGDDRIYKMLKNPTYAGFVADKFTDYELVNGKHPSIISLATFERNQALLHGQNSRLGEAHVGKNALYPLRGRILCGNCMQPLYASAPTAGSGISSPRYHCARRTCVGKVPSVKASVVHQDFVELLRKLKPSEGLLNLYKTILIREANNELDNINMRIKSARKKLERLSELRSATIQKFVEGTITVQEKNDLIDKLDLEKLECNDELIQLENKQSLKEADIEGAINIMRYVDKQWESADLDLKQRFQNLIFPEGLVYNTEQRKFGTSKISTLYRYTGIKKASKETSSKLLVAGGGLEPPTLWL